jgi:hypothetical protein
VQALRDHLRRLEGPTGHGGFVAELKAARVATVLELARQRTPDGERWLYPTTVLCEMAGISRQYLGKITREDGCARTVGDR